MNPSSPSYRSLLPAPEKQNIAYPPIAPDLDFSAISEIMEPVYSFPHIFAQDSITTDLDQHCQISNIPLTFPTLDDEFHKDEKTWFTFPMSASEPFSVPIVYHQNMGMENLQFPFETMQPESLQVDVRSTGSSISSASTTVLDFPNNSTHETFNLESTKSRRRVKTATMKQCENCQTTEAPAWRRDKSSRLLCNA